MACNTSSSLISAAENYDALTEILLRLPSKSLIRFQLVCKQWQSLIFDKYFTRQHTCSGLKLQQSFLLHAKTTSQFFYFNLTIKKLVPFYFPNNLGHVKLLHSCNGLLLLECSRTDSDKEYYVCNPTTMKSRNLLFESSYLRKGTISGFYLRFNPSESEHYKVYCLRRSRAIPDRRYFVAKYKSKTHKWKRWFTHSDTDTTLYWYNSIRGIGPDHESLFYFLLPSRNYSIFEALVITVPVRRSKYIVDSSGNMYGAILYLHPNNNDNVCVYRMGTNSWSRSWSVELGRVPVTLDKDINVLNINITGYDDDYFDLLFQMPGKIMVHRLYKDATSEVLLELSGEDYYKAGELQFELDDAHQFIETLARV